MDLEIHAGAPGWNGRRLHHTLPVIYEGVVGGIGRLQSGPYPRPFGLHAQSIAIAM